MPEGKLPPHIGEAVTGDTEVVIIDNRCRDSSRDTRAPLSRCNTEDVVQLRRYSPIGGTH
jgi:hypothetical protein